MAKKGLKDQALRPDYSVRPFIEPKVEDVQTLTKEEEILAAGSENAFWKILKGHFDNSIEQLEQLNEIAIAQGASREQIGENSIVISQVKGVLKKIINVVEDAHEQMDKGALDGRGKEK